MTFGRLTLNAEEREQYRKLLIGAGFAEIEADELICSPDFLYGVQITREHLQEAFPTQPNNKEG